MEINPRLAGGFIPRLVHLATGVDVIAATIALVTGACPDLRPMEQSHASIRFICPDADGRIVGVAGLDGARTLDGVAEVRLYPRRDDDYVVHHDFRDRIGHVIARGSSDREARDAAVRAQQAIEVRFAGA
jgi:biotin carboxylase